MANPRRARNPHFSFSFALFWQRQWSRMKRKWEYDNYHELSRWWRGKRGGKSRLRAGKTITATMWYLWTVVIYILWWSERKITSSTGLWMTKNNTIYVMTTLVGVSVRLLVCLSARTCLFFCLHTNREPWKLFVPVCLWRKMSTFSWEPPCEWQKCVCDENEHFLTLWRLKVSEKR